MGQHELPDFLATGNDLKVRGIVEDVNLKVIEEPVVDNGTHTQEHQEPYSNHTDHDGKTLEMSNQKNESEVTTASNQQEGGRFVCSECNAGFSSAGGLMYKRGPYMKE